MAGWKAIWRRWCGPLPPFALWLPAGQRGGRHIVAARVPVPAIPACCHRGSRTLGSDESCQQSRSRHDGSRQRHQRAAASLIGPGQRLGGHCIDSLSRACVGCPGCRTNLRSKRPPNSSPPCRSPPVGPPASHCNHPNRSHTQHGGGPQCSQLVQQVGTARTCVIVHTRISLAAIQRSEHLLARAVD